MKDSELLRLKKSPSHESIQPMISRYFPLVWNVAASCPDETDRRKIIHAVFGALAKCRGRCPRKTYLPAWFVRSALYALRNWHRSQLRKTIPKNARMQASSHHENHCEDRYDYNDLHPLNRLSNKLFTALIAHAFLEKDFAKVADALGISQNRARRRLAKAQHKLAKMVSRTKGNPIHLDFLSATIPSNVKWDANCIARKCWEQAHRSPIVKGIFAGWRWFIWKRRLKFIATSASLFIAMGISFVGFFMWGWYSGYLMSWGMPLMAKAVLKENPELAIPPRFWQGKGKQVSLISKRAELFGLTNLWRVDFTFSPEQWNAMKPEKIKPTRLINESGVVLRNPHAPRSGLAGVLGIHFVWSRADLQIGGQSFPKSSIRYRGNGTYIGSLFGKKQPFKIDLNKTDPDQKLFGLDKLNFNNFVEDASYMHDALGYDLFRLAGIHAPRTAYAWISVEITGLEKRTPRGLYLMLENVDQHFARARFGTSLPIFKPVTPRLFEDLGDDWADYAAIYDLKTKATEAQKQRIIEFAKCLSHDDDPTFARRISQFLDLDQFSRYLSVMVLLASYDGFLSNGQNFYLYLDPQSDRFGFIPWDLDHAWGDFFLIGTPSQRDQASIWHPWVGSHRLLERLMQLDSFREMYENQLKKLLDTQFKLELLSPKIDMMARSIDALVERENPLRYRRFRKAVADDFGEPPPIHHNTLRPVNAMKRFIKARRKSVLSQLAGESEGVILQPM